MHKGSILASQIDREYREKQAYRKKPREKCKEKNCMACRYRKVCTDDIEKVCESEKDVQYGIKRNINVSITKVSLIKL